MFFHNILQQNEDSLLFCFFMAQLKNPTKGDWVTSVMEEMDELELGLQLDDIKSMTKNSFRKIVKEKVQQKALEYLLNKKESHISENAKGKLLKYEKLKIQEYLNSSNLNISVNEKKWLFKCRVEDIDLPSNSRWRNEDTFCKNCLTIEMNQSNLLSCQYLLEKNKITEEIPLYEDIFQEDISKQMTVCRILKKNFTKFKHPMRTM